MTRKNLIIGALAVALAGFAACGGGGGSGGSTSLTSGTWEDSRGWVMSFGGDGSFSGSHPGGYSEVGTYTMSGNVIMVTLDGGSAFEWGVYEGNRLVTSGNTSYIFLPGAQMQRMANQAMSSLTRDTWEDSRGWVMTFGSNGSFSGSHPSGNSEVGTFTMSGNGILVTLNGGEIFQWGIYDGDQLVTSGTPTYTFVSTAQRQNIAAQAARGGGNVADAPESAFQVTLTSDGAGVVITGYTGTARSFRIPATIQGMPVREIGQSAFGNATVPRQPDNRVDNIVIPEGVTVIHDFAFGNSNIVSVSLPSTLLRMGRGVFWGTENLRNITLPAGLRELGPDTFNESGLTALPSPWPTGMTSLGHRTFEGANLSGHLVIPEGITHIGSTAFQRNPGITSVTLPSTIQEIDGGAFHGLPNLQNVIIHESVTRIRFSGNVFSNTSNFPLASQARLRQLGLNI